MGETRNVMSLLFSISLCFVALFMFLLTTDAALNVASLIQFGGKNVK